MPNIILPLFASPLALKIGITNALLFYTVLVIVGAGLNYIAVMNSIRSYVILMIGSCIFGIG